MKLKELINKILFFVSVPKCVGCKKRLNIDDFALCPDCLDEYYNIKARNCSICSKQLCECTCSNQYLKSHYIHKIIKVFRYIHRDPLPSNNLIYSLKRDNRRDVLEFLTNELCSAISNSIDKPEEYVFINVPRRKESIRKYGMDHAEMLAKSVAKHFSAQYYQPLYSNSKHEQKHMSSIDRMKNANFKLKRNAKDLKGKNVILFDDIVTTGASMGSAAMLLRALNAKKIVGAVIAIAYKDDYTPLNTEDRFLPYKKI